MTIHKTEMEMILELAIIKSKINRFVKDAIKQIQTLVSQLTWTGNLK